MNLVLRLVSIVLLLAAWVAASHFVGPRLLPEPQTVWFAIVHEARSGALAFNLGVTLARVAVAFAIAMTLGTIIGLAMGRIRAVDQLADPWLLVLLNLPALVIIVLAYVWAGLTEAAAIVAVALNKLPIATVTVREGARALDHTLTEMATVFRMSRWLQLRHLILPQLAPYLAAAARSGLSLVWKIARRLVRISSPRWPKAGPRWSMVGLSMARSTRSGTFVGPGIWRKCRPAWCCVMEPPTAGRQIGAYRWACQ